MSKDDYEVGYKRTPKHTRFVPGESGNKGRKKKRPEFQAEIVARIRDELITVDGRTISAFELALLTTRNATIKRGHPRDLKSFLEILDKYGGVPKDEMAAASRAAADRVIERIIDVFDKTHDIDPADTKELDVLRREEAAVVMKCESCSPKLRERWNLSERKALSARHGQTGLQSDVEASKKAS